MPYTIDYQPGLTSPDEAIAILRDSQGLRVAELHGEHAASTAQLLSTALTNPDPYATIQQQAAELAQLRPLAERLERLTKQLDAAGETNRRTIAELIRLQGCVTERNLTIARLQQTAQQEVALQEVSHGN